MSLSRLHLPTSYDSGRYGHTTSLLSLSFLLDFVYFESSATAPYQIRRIDELNKTPTGAVEAKVACYFRRRDVSIALINQAEKYYVNDNDSDEEDSDANGKSAATISESNKRSGSVADLDKHRIKHRELFLSRQIECLPATHIRGKCVVRRTFLSYPFSTLTFLLLMIMFHFSGKCSVTLYNDAEPLANYLAREDAFYYKLIYDPSLKTLQEDRGAMRIGSDHQSEIQPLLKSSETDPRFSSKLEELVWQPGLLTNEEVDMFCLLARAVGTLGRGYDNASTTRQPLLLGAAASAGRDITRQYAHDLLHKANYDIKVAISLLLPGGQPVVCRDQLEDWSPSEAHLFEEALDKYSKVFPDILSDYLPWKTHKSLVELYYFWKTTDRYVRQRRTKLAAQEHKLKQVYIPNYSKPSPSVLYNGSDKSGRGCEGCAATSSSQWYAWGPQNLLYRLCSSCWTYWKRYGGLQNLTPKGSGPNSPSSGGRPCPEQRAQERATAARNPLTESITSNEMDADPSVDAGVLRSVPFPTTVVSNIVLFCACVSNSKMHTQPIIARLSDPSSLLLRPRPRPPVNQVIATVAARKNISLQSLDLSAALNSVQLNGPILTTTKRPHSSSPDRNDSGRRNGTELDAVELINGTGGQDSASPPPCKKQAIGVNAKCPNLTETSNGLLIDDGTDDQDGQHF
ncbi:hypothetical protein PHET_06319 [Paragonimus heterotremus]|uniref:Metastasis-associated protein MTA3 n=1 Tax=Paragonimus heterotremus TaxID=100268 RepID=A0A8J4WGA9_9TREM|nr:hypothetical protein PHET_06319 [Paragonimus heterotremus]